MRNIFDNCLKNNKDAISKYYITKNIRKSVDELSLLYFERQATTISFYLYKILFNRKISINKFCSYFLKWHVDFLIEDCKKIGINLENDLIDYQL